MQNKAILDLIGSCKDEWFEITYYIYPWSMQWQQGLGVPLKCSMSIFLWPDLFKYIFQILDLYHKANTVFEKNYLEVFFWSFLGLFRDYWFESQLPQHKTTLQTFFWVWESFWGSSLKFTSSSQGVRRKIFFAFECFLLVPWAAYYTPKCLESCLISVVNKKYVFAACMGIFWIIWF